MCCRVRVIVLAGIVCAFAICAFSERGDSEEVKKMSYEKFNSSSTGNLKYVITTKDPTIPLEELKLLVKPLTKEELQAESLEWLLILKKKIQQISNTEITIKRKNKIINKEKKVIGALRRAKSSLKENESAKMLAIRGSQEYQNVKKRVEKAKESLRKAESIIQEAKKAKREIQQDKALSNVLEKAKEKGEIEKAKQERRNMVVGSSAYKKVTKKINALEMAIKALESDHLNQKQSILESLEYEQATRQLEVAEESLQRVISAIGEAEITSNENAKIPSLGNVVNEKDSLQEKKNTLEKAAEKLEENTDEDTKLKNQLVINATELQSEKTAVVDRFKIILDELELKGGDPKPYRQYIKAINIIELQLKDTDGIGVRLITWFKSREGGLRWGVNLSQFMGIIFASIIVSQILAIILNLFLTKIDNISVLLSRFVILFVKRGGIAVGFMIALTALEVSLSPILSMLGGASFILAFALQSNISNFASGLMMMLYKPFDIGDEVKLNGIWGCVDSINLASTKIKGFQGQIFNIPNNVVWSGMIETLTQSKNRKVQIWLRVEFSENLKYIEQLLIEMMKSHPKILQSPSPSTFVWQIEEYYISVSISGWTRKEDYWSVHADYIRLIQEHLIKEGVSIAAIPLHKEILIRQAPSTTSQVISNEISNSPESDIHLEI